MTKLQLSALSLIIIATTGLTIFNLFKHDTNQEVNISTIEPNQSKKAVLPNEKPPVKVASIERRALPVAHGVADENGRQIHEGNLPRRLPPPISAPNRQDHEKQSHSASQHGHEQNHSTEHKNTPPPPVGANK